MNREGETVKLPVLLQKEIIDGHCNVSEKPYFFCVNLRYYSKQKQ